MEAGDRPVSDEADRKAPVALGERERERVAAIPDHAFKAVTGLMMSRGKSGEADLTCSDGRTGKLLFLVGDDEAVGTGMLGKDIMTLTIAGADAF